VGYRSKQSQLLRYDLYVDQRYLYKVFLDIVKLTMLTNGNTKIILGCNYSYNINSLR